MEIRTWIETYYAQQAQAFEQSQTFQAFESGVLNSEQYDRFIQNLCSTHLKSPQILAFLYAAVPPSVAPTIQHNMLEELGLDEEGISHPNLLRQLAAAAGFTAEGRSQLEASAQEELRRMCTDPFLYGTLKEFGLNVLLEVTCFEWMLSRLSGRMGKALQQHRGLASESLEWFFHHSEVDIRHAEEGLDTVVEYIRYYEFDRDEVEAIADITFRENIFLKRYFGAAALTVQPDPLEV